ncbi:hypothetical protein [Halopseudomonas salina]|uniref:Sec-independent protein translocase protein TatB n=1 Tax=Halopseudomonas salina TaxID=1323744 RepID=A0ABQ1P0D8_9GAMM|nr:hypothetical protein [Halopseudomonas salina]GGC86584.1 hypothetical protein GCM10007418_02930 [Halopseudomonas salina]
MFDNGLSEWVLVLVVALLVLGPQKALVIVNMAGLMLGKAKAAMAQVQEQVARELPREELEVVQETVQELRRSNVKRKAIEVLGLEEKRADTVSASPSSVAVQHSLKELQLPGQLEHTRQSAEQSQPA